MLESRREDQERCTTAERGQLRLACYDPIEPIAKHERRYTEQEYRELSQRVIAKVRAATYLKPSISILLVSLQNNDSFTGTEGELILILSGELVVRIHNIVSHLYHFAHPKSCSVDAVGDGGSQDARVCTTMGWERRRTGESCPVGLLITRLDHSGSKLRCFVREGSSRSNRKAAVSRKRSKGGLI